MSENTAEIGELGTASYERETLKLEQREGSITQCVLLEPFEVLQLLRFIDQQAALRALQWESYRLEGKDPRPEWKYSAQYKTWRYIVGHAHIELAPRPSYCDRGRWIAIVDGVGDIDHQDAFPRYFMDLTRAKLEMQEWLEFRMRDYTDSEFKQYNNTANRIRALRDALRHLDGQLTDTEAAGFALAYQALQSRLAPNLDADL